MDPFARKMILSSVAFGSVMAFFIGIFSIVYFHERPRCSEQVLAETASPQWKAAVLQRRCGDDAPFVVHVNVGAAGDSIRLGYFSGKATEGEVFATEQEAIDVVPDLDWTGPAALTIRCPACRSALVSKRDDHIGAIAIHYELGR